MVDAVVSFVVGKLGDFLIQEAVFLGRVRNEVKWLKNELGWLQCYIANAEEKQVDNPMIRMWLSDITGIAYDTEDVLDKFILQVSDDRATDLYKVHDEETNEEKPGCFGSMSCCTLNKRSSNPYSEGKKKVNLYNIGKEVEGLKNRINDLSRKRKLYGLQDSADKNEVKSNTTVGRLKQLRKATSFSFEERVVGYEDDATRLLAKLFEQDPCRFVISIYGMGGLGKTTLARKLYHNHDVKRRFHCCAWVCVSQDYNTCDLLIRIIKSFGITTMTTEDLKRMSEEDLERYLHQSLQGHSYLVVIDDVWHKEAWESLRRAFPDSKKGSRVIITTRIKEVAERSDEKTYVYKLRFLRLDESWQLFCEKAFGASDANDADAELKELGMGMVQRCNGLPLAIAVLGGLLSTKSRPQEWKMVRDHIWQNLRNDSIHISYLLDLGFKDLTYQLKLCFLYLSLFPEDFEIDVEKLMQLWIAEGFIVQYDNRVLEDVAKETFNELINRSLIHIERRSWGRVVTCRVHDLLRDLAIQKARVLNFLHIYDDIKHLSDDSLAISSCRRKAIYSGNKMSFWLQQSNPSLRSLLFFNPYRSTSRQVMQQPTHVFTKFRFLRVLDLNGCHVPMNTLASWEEIAKLIHLRYLCIRQSRIRNPPPSIVNLQKLQTLDLFDTDKAIELPNEISKLQELKHLIGSFFGHLSIHSLRKLQSLKCVTNEGWSMIDTKMLVSLRELSIYGPLPVEFEEFSFDSIANLKRLEQLSVKLQFFFYPVPSWQHCFASLQPLSSCSNLIDLRLSGKLEKLPEDMHAVLPNLECLLLENSWLQDDPMRLLEKLPWLMMLYLGSRFYNGKKLTCRAQGFPRLEVLKLDKYNDEIEVWQVGEGAMPRLRGLSIPEDSKLIIPERFKSIPPPDEWELDRGCFDMLL